MGKLVIPEGSVIRMLGEDPSSWNSATKAPTKRMPKHPIVNPPKAESHKTPCEGPECPLCARGDVPRVRKY